MPAVPWRFSRASSLLQGERVQLRSGRPVGRLALAFDLLAPSRGRAQVLRSGQPGMDAGLAAYGHGWPIAAGPWSRTGARECRALARHRTKGARAFGYLGLFQVTRRKGGTVSGRDRRNGYVHPQKPTPPATQPLRAGSLPQGELLIHPPHSSWLPAIGYATTR